MCAFLRVNQRENDARQFCLMWEKTGLPLKKQEREKPRFFQTDVYHPSFFGLDLVANQNIL